MTCHVLLKIVIRRGCHVKKSVLVGHRDGLCSTDTERLFLQTEISASYGHVLKKASIHHRESHRTDWQTDKGLEPRNQQNGVVLVLHAERPSWRNSWGISEWETITCDSRLISCSVYSMEK